MISGKFWAFSAFRPRARECHTAKGRRSAFRFAVAAPPARAAPTHHPTHHPRGRCLGTCRTSIHVRDRGDRGVGSSARGSGPGIRRAIAAASGRLGSLRIGTATHVGSRVGLVVAQLHQKTTCKGNPTLVFGRSPTSPITIHGFFLKKTTRKGHACDRVPDFNPI